MIAREGYFQLTWDVTNASESLDSFRVYELDSGDDGTVRSGSLDGQGAETLEPLVVTANPAQRVVYEGTLPIAFVSGLPDGTYRYHVEALNAEGELLARSDMPATVQVLHWPVWQALVLLVIGALVFLAVVVVIVQGTRA
ncbi:hypothetical protein [Rhodopirellula sp. P2]|uniref:hypothetical protein n=1 Tax=Rhodopirellula sp. P2 TaxID=2127060 RepID=UPI002368E627|nr:hypothetical protein [Rhodopirellula sp. P2]WDQ16423.1 hypothetical protein PSR62_22775 [Rhodopirellula sp. P2]